MGEREKLTGEIGSKDVIRYFYLDHTAAEVLEKIDSMKMKLVESQDEVPFNAQVKGYLAAQDEDGDPWIVKPVTSDEDMVFHRSCMLAYLLDHETGTFAAPTSARLIDGKKFRMTKVVKHSVQISSYNYLESPFINILRADLVNRWIYFDEDRNPNNYLVVTNSRNKPFVISIDYDKADMMSEEMKITGTPDKFGWVRTGKNRFLTLLCPENFEGISISDFENRLASFAAVNADDFLKISQAAFKPWCSDSDAKARIATDNFLKRREYVDGYFRQMFKAKEETPNVSNDGDYLAFGKSFLDMHNKNR